MVVENPVILIIAAASGTGKSSLARALVESACSTVLSVSHTTRDIRANEVDGCDYFFISERSFLQMVGAGKFIEYARVYDHYYGTSREVINSSLAAGLNVVLDIDWQGARQVACQFDSVVSVFLLPPSIAALESRLVKRQRDSKTTIQTRLDLAKEDMKHCTEFTHIILNDQFEAALQDLKALLPGGSGIIRPLPSTLPQQLEMVAGLNLSSS